jgi:cell wall-associated NlpC family hydrolase
MLRTREPGAVRPESSHARRFARAAATTTLLAGLVGGGLVATGATTASAAPAKPKATVTLKVSDKSFKKGARPLITTTSKTKGKATAGKAYFYVSGRLVKVATLHHGKASYRLSSKVSKKLSAAHHRVRATIHPSSSAVRGNTKYTTVLVHKYSSRVVEKAVRYTGVRYRYGGTSPRGFDCSGFTSYVYKHEHVKKLPRTSSGQRHAGKVVSKRHAKPGDLVYTPGHVAIYVGGNKIIDAPRPGKSIHVRSMWHASWTFIHVSAKANSI